jgi:nuclear respiratory factor 1
MLIYNINKQYVEVFGAKPLEDVVRNMKNVIMCELETALSQQAPNPCPEDPSLHELPPVCVDGIPTPVEKMTQVTTDFMEKYVCISS